MTIPDSDLRGGPYVGDGVATAFATRFKLLDAAHATVLRKVAGVETTLTLDSDYTVSNVGSDSGATVTLSAPLADGAVLVIVPNPPFSQATDYQDQAAIFHDTLERDIDLTVQRDRQLLERMGRAIVLRPTDAGTSVDLPSADAGKVLGWSSTSPVKLENKAAGSAFPVESDGTLAQSGGGTGATTLGAGAITPTGLSVSRTLAAQAANRTGLFVDDPEFTSVALPGSGDWTARINAAHDKLLAVEGGGELLFKPGTKLVRGPVLIDSGLAYLVGSGRQATILTTDQTTGDMIVFEKPAASLGFCGARSMTVQSTVTRTADAGVKLLNAREITLSDMRFSTQVIAIEHEGSVLCRLDNIDIFNPIPSTGVGVLHTSGNDLYASGVFVEGLEGQQPKAAWDVKSTTGLWIGGGGGMHRTGTGFLARPETGDLFENVFIYDKVAADTLDGVGFDFAIGDGVTAQRIRLIATWAATCTGAGIRTRRTGTTGIVDDMLIFATDVVNGQSDGMDIDDMRNLRIIAGSVAGNSGATSNTKDGIVLGANVSGVRILGTLIGEQGTFGPSHRYGLNIHASVTDYFVEADFTGNVTGSVSEGPSPAASRVIRSGRGVVAENSGVVSVTSGSDGRFSINHGLSFTPRFYSITPQSETNVAVRLRPPTSSEIRGTLFDADDGTTVETTFDAVWMAMR